MVVRLLILVGLQTTEYRQLWMLSRVEWSISTHICQWWVRLMLIDAFIWSLECGNIGKSSISPLPPGGLSYSSVRHWWNGCVHANIPNGCVQSGYNTRINLLDRDVMTYIVGTACVQCPLPTAASFTDRVIRHPLSLSVSIYMRSTSSITAKLIIECR